MHRKYDTQTLPEDDLVKLFASRQHKDKHTHIFKKVRSSVWGHQPSLVNILTGKSRAMQSALLEEDAKEHGSHQYSESLPSYKYWKKDTGEETAKWCI